LSPASAVIAPAIERVSLAMTPTVRPSMRPSAVNSSGAKAGRSTVRLSTSQRVSAIGCTSYDVRSRSGTRSRSGSWGEADHSSTAPRK
jgi:hypothetical protein